MNPSIFQNHHVLDFHTHRPRQADREDIMEIVSMHLGREIEADYYTIGMHPWWTTSDPTDEQKKKLQIHLTDSQCLAMGEMGLDNLKGPNLSIQMNILRSQLKIAQQLDKPVIIHCVRAYDQLLKMKKEFPDISKWCIHGYGRHVTLARQLIDQGFYLSLMPSPSTKYRDWFESLPVNRLFLETDSMASAQIEDIYDQVAQVSGFDQTKLRQQIGNNARDFFRR